MEPVTGKPLHDVLTGRPRRRTWPCGNGPAPEHVAGIRLPPPGPAPAPLVIFLHGGFWRAKFDRAHTGPMATALAAAGYAVCVPEVRRTGQEGGGWPGTFGDVAAAIDALPALLREEGGPGAAAAGPVLLAGHSAGGHLALWAAARHRLPANTAWRPAQPSVRGVVALAPVTGLAVAHARWLGDGAADALMGGSPAAQPERYRAEDPEALIPFGRPVRLVHGTRGDRVPVDMSRDFLARAAAAGADITLAELAGAGHFEVIDPLSTAWPAVLAAFAKLIPLDPGRVN